MVERVVFDAETRQQVGSQKAAELRAAGRLPAIVYGHKQQPVAISLNSHDFTEAIHHGYRLFDLKLDGRTETLLVKAVQYDHLGRQVIHADLVRVDLTELVRVEVPIVLKGTAKGTHEGGILDEHLDHLEVECTVTQIPEVIPVSVRDLVIGDALRAKDVQLPEGVRLLTAPEAILVACHVVAAAKSTEELQQEAPTAPEVITERVKEEQAEEEKGKK